MNLIPYTAQLVTQMCTLIDPKKTKPDSYTSSLKHEGLVRAKIPTPNCTTNFFFSSNLKPKGLLKPLVNSSYGLSFFQVKVSPTFTEVNV